LTVRYAVYPGKVPARTRVLHVLASSQGRTVSGDEIGQALRISRPAVWKHVRSLMAEGFPIRPVANRGYRLTQPLDLIMPDVVAGLLRTSFVGRTILCAPTTGSTNEDAKALAGNSTEGTVFIAETQSGGKGRIGRSWSSPPGGIFMSVLLKPSILPSRLPALSLVAGYSVARAIRDCLDLDARVKWPNDVLVDGLKVCGILCEMRAEVDRVEDVVVGIGVNANLDIATLPPEVRETATTLGAQSGREVDRNRLIAAILNRLEPSYKELVASGLDALAPRIVETCAFLGQPVALRNLTASDGAETLGIFQGIDREGMAILKLHGGETRAFPAGDLSLRPAPHGHTPA
jgi:BirA family biotin operon repressor/biotin-[acetyl-CoA-carboxylase] ligase